MDKNDQPLTISLSGTKKIKFTVASALLSQLGERLVGAPHIALAELVKNAYDADATRVIIRMMPDRIEVVDDGHGMDFDEFRDFWMRVGTPHKETKRVSPALKRPMTGSKGVGRLAVQFLASRIEIHTVSKKDPNSELQAFVNWEDAIQAGDLIEAEALFKSVDAQASFPENKPHGTAIILANLKQAWTPQETKKLAQEIWWLQPPFRSNPNVKTDEQKNFQVILESADEVATREFDAQMRAAHNNWYARIVGRLLPKTGKSKEEKRIVKLAVDFHGDSEPITYEYSVPSETYLVPYCHVNSLEFEIRIFYLWGKQRAEISVSEARDYFKEFGGVHVYDAGFHLPYYGPDTDWLHIETDHSHRLAESKLLPKKLQEGVTRGLNFLPTQQRIFGVVNIDTSAEREAAKKSDNPNDYLNIDITRDRLVRNEAFADLCYIVRFALDYYAFQEARRKAKEREAQSPIETSERTFERLEEVLQEYQDDIPKDVYKEIRNQARAAQQVSARKDEAFGAQAGLLGALATAGISAIAYEHEVAKQFQFVEEIVEDIRKVRVSETAARHKLDDIAAKLTEWANRARATRAIFSPLMEEENREAKGRFKARVLIDQVRSQIAVLTGSISINTSEIDESWRLPEGRFTEWSAVFQNVFVNAFNAMLDSEIKMIAISSRAQGRSRAILVQDTGIGVDLETAKELFEPFIRKQKISRERRQLGLGGTGLGLTIIRMIAESRDCKVAFVEPDRGFSTAFSLSWSETK